MQCVVALVVGAAQRSRLLHATGDQARLTFVPTGSELESATRQLQSAGTSTVIITEPQDAHRAPVAPAIRRLVGEFPGIAVFAYLSFKADDLRALADLTRAGITDVLIQGVDDQPRLLRDALARAAARTAAAEGFAILSPFLPQAALSFVAYVALHASDPLSVSQVAREVGAARRTIAHTLTQSHLPAAARLIGWFRVLHAVTLLSQRSQTATHVAAILGFPSLAAMDNLFDEYLGLSPKNLRGPDARARALAAFGAEIRASRGVDMTAHNGAGPERPLSVPVREVLEQRTDMLPE